MADLGTKTAVHLPPGRHGRVGGEPGVTLEVAPPRTLVSVIARRGRIDALTAAVKRAFDADLPTTPRLARGRDVSFLWCGHLHWFAQADAALDLQSKLRTEVGSEAAVSDQSDSRLIVTVAGPAARAMLAKLAPIDFHPRAFCANDTGITLLGHISGQVTQVDERPSYELMVFRSFADAFCESVFSAAAEFGVEVLPTRGL